MLQNTTQTQIQAANEKSKNCPQIRRITEPSTEVTEKEILQDARQVSPATEPVKLLPVKTKKSGSELPH